MTAFEGRCRSIPNGALVFSLFVSGKRDGLSNARTQSLAHYRIELIGRWWPQSAWLVKGQAIWRDDILNITVSHQSLHRETLVEPTVAVFV